MLSDPDAEELLAPPLSDIAVRLADEGVPLRAICRSLKCEAEIARFTIHQAIDDGTILEMPREDWPPTGCRSSRLPTLKRGNEDAAFLLNCMRFLGVTKLHAKVLHVLIRRNEVTKEAIHHAIKEKERLSDHANPSGIKLVDVVIHHLRKRLKRFDIKINTIWGIGYEIEPASKRVLLEMIQAGIRAQEDPLAELEQVCG